MLTLQKFYKLLMWLLISKKICDYNITFKIINGIPSKKYNNN